MAFGISESESDYGMTAPWPKQCTAEEAKSPNNSAGHTGHEVAVSVTTTHMPYCKAAPQTPPATAGVATSSPATSQAFFTGRPATAFDNYSSFCVVKHNKASENSLVRIQAAHPD